MTALTGVNQLIQALQASVAGASLAALQLELFNAFREFCQRSNAWVAFDSQAYEQGVTDYSIFSPDARAQISTVLSVAIDGRPIVGWAGRYLPGDNSFQTGHLINPEKLIDSAVNSVRLPAGGYSGTTLQVGMALRPTLLDLDNLYLPEMLAQEHFDTIRCGALARLLAHRGRPYFDREFSKENRRQFLSGLGRARQKTLVRFAQQPAPWRFPQQAPGRRAV